jgi:hypothetical protein
MVMSTQLTWRETTDNPVRSLQNQYDMRELIGAEITGRSEVSAAMVDIGVRITYSIGSEVDSRETSYRVIREIGAYEPSADRGTWGVNPISAM